MIPIHIHRKIEFLVYLNSFSNAKPRLRSLSSVPGSGHESTFCVTLYSVPRPPRNFLCPFIGPYFSRRVQNFEIGIYCLLKILANEKDVQGMNMILLDCFCALTLQNAALAFFVPFGFACKKQLIGNF